MTWIGTSLGSDSTRFRPLRRPCIGAENPFAAIVNRPIAIITFCRTTYNIMKS
jgi:hypothetical protein